MPQKYVLVTGSSRGIGKSIALKFASEGWHVFLNCRYRMDALQNVKEEIEASTPGSCELLPGDVSSPADVAHIFRKIHASCGCLDVLVNNAGISHIGLLTDMSDREWEQIIHTNLSLRLLLLQSRSSSYGVQKSRTDYQHFFYMGYCRRFLRSCLLSGKVRGTRLHKGTGQRTGAK